jgi:type I restriction enzyme S subunit
MIQVPDGWEVKPFSSLASINMGQSPESEFVNENQEGIAFLQGNADFGDINPKELYWVKVPKKLAKKDDILISVRAPVGDINMADKEYCIGRGLSALTIKKINQKFGFYALFQERIQLDRLAQGSTFLAIGKNDFDKLLIKYPKEKKEQEKIAKILLTLDNAIESTNRIIEKEKNIKTALMQELLTNGIDKNGQIRTPQTHTYKPSELGLIPDEWEVKALKSVGSCKNGLTYSPDDIVESDGVLVLRSSNIKNNKLTFSDNVFVREDMKVNYKVQENDILICVRNGSKKLIGKNALITRESINMAHGAFMTVFHSNINEYVFQLFQSDLFFKQVEKNLGATINSINNSDLLLFDFSFPKDEIEQKQITKILTTQDEKIEIEEKNLAKLKELKKGLMNDLLSGNVRVNV